MLTHRTGVIGLPLRLLAREVFDRVRQECGPSAVALVTGEERIVPERARYWVCTVEAMPAASGAEFLCVDEIQLCADRERGHVFTDRLLRARGQSETLFLGSDNMRPAIAKLVRNVQFERKDRLSSLSFTGARRISRLRPRSALVAFSVEEVYALAEAVRRQKGGAAVVMGALSPRTRNAQVGLYQSGEVDFLVATDAIGMGLNLDIDHVAFAGLKKFDGTRMRGLAPNEIAQIAGRAGRFRSHGTFGTTGDSDPLHPQTAVAVEEGRFRNLTALQWRNSDLDFRSSSTLLASLRLPAELPMLARAGEEEDVAVLREVSETADAASGLRSPAEVKLLWNVCQIPNFLASPIGVHADLVRTVFSFVKDKGFIPDDWLEQQIRRVDRCDGDVDALAHRIAGIRIWTYVAQRAGWVENAEHWQERTRAAEDRISDALHAGLTKRFVDRRTSVLINRMKRKESLVATVSNDGDVTVEGERVGQIKGFRFIQSPASTPGEERVLKAASLQVLESEYAQRAARLARAPNSEIDLTEQGGLMWGDCSVGKLIPGRSGLEPDIEVFVDEQAGEKIRDRVKGRLTAFVDQKITSTCESLKDLTSDASITGTARGVAYRLSESYGVINRSAISEEIKLLDQDSRKLLRKHGVRFGQRTIYAYPVLRPEATRWRIVLWSVASGFDEFPPAPPPGLVTLPTRSEMPEGYYPLCGYSRVGGLEIRIDMLERLLNLLREQDGQAGFEATADMLSITGLTLTGFADLMRGLGYSAEMFEKEKPTTVSKESAPNADSVPGAEDGQLREAASDDIAEPAAEVKAESASGKDDVDRAVAPAEASEPIPSPDGSAQALPEGPSSEPDKSEQTSALLESEASETEPAKEPVIGYTFTWRPRRKHSKKVGSPRPAQNRRERDGRAQDGLRQRKVRSPKKRDRNAGKRRTQHESRTEAVDLDSPFSVLRKLKDRM